MFWHISWNLCCWLKCFYFFVFSTYTVLKLAEMQARCLVFCSCWTWHLISLLHEYKGLSVRCIFAESTVHIYLKNIVVFGVTCRCCYLRRTGFSASQMPLIRRVWKHCSRWIGYAKLRCQWVCECVCAWCPEIYFSPIQGEFSSLASNFLRKHSRSVALTRVESLLNCKDSVASWVIAFPTEIQTEIIGSWLVNPVSRHSHS